MADTQGRVDLAEDEAVESSTSPWDEWISLLRDVNDEPKWPIILRREDTPALDREALQTHLSKNPDAVAKLLDQEKRLRPVIRVSAENGHLDAVEKAVPALKQMLEIHPFLPGHILQMDQQCRKCVSKAAEKNFENIELVKEAVTSLVVMKNKHPDWTIDMWDREPLLDYCDDCFYSPLMYACEAGHVPVALYFRRNGATADYIPGHGLFECRDGKRVSFWGSEVTVHNHGKNTEIRAVPHSGKDLHYATSTQSRDRQLYVFTYRFTSFSWNNSDAELRYELALALTA